MSSQARLCIVLPAHNEAETLPGALASLVEVLGRCPADPVVCIVDDGSADETWLRIRELCRAMPERVVGLRLSRHFGKDASILAGLAGVEADAYIVMDADGQHPVELIPEFVRLWRAGHDIVNGVKRSRGRDPRGQRATGLLFNRTFSALSGLDLSASSDFKLVSRRAAEAIVRCGDYRAFFRGLSRWVGFSQCDVPFDVQGRAAGDSKWSVLGLVSYAVDAIVLHSNLPLQVIVLIGLLSLVLSGALIAKLLWGWSRGAVPSGYATLLVVSLLAFSGIMVALGIIGLYLQQILNQVKGRPRFLVMERTRDTDGD